MTAYSSLNPLSVGNVVSLGVQLWRSQIKSYFWLSLRAYLWLIPFFFCFLFLYGSLFAFLAGVIPGFSEEVDIPVAILDGLGAAAGILLVFALVMIPLALYGWAKFVLISALISRLTFKELSNQPESIAAARQDLDPRLWSFLGVAFRVGILMFVLYLGLVILAVVVLGILGFVMVALFGGDSPSDNILLGLVIALLVILGVIGLVLLPIAWFYTRWMLSELPLAIEPQLTTAASIRRSWQLTQGSVGRLFLITFIAGIVTLPVQLIVGYLPQVPFDIAGLLLPEDSWLFFAVTTASFIVSLLAGFVSGALILPFWQVIKAILYYDLRNRKEGLGLHLSE
ncbi:MAG: glycerophosphoryl diester phosphodiesterase membrane domain-containing protein [Cyanobacteriota bacterium]|nr:glycerophosphoryl diester phosphodiesterase membrane domain-containing protein [Cyanobacteriota bacterium]